MDWGRALDKFLLGMIIAVIILMLVILALALTGSLSAGGGHGGTNCTMVPVGNGVIVPVCS